VLLSNRWQRVEPNIGCAPEKKLVPTKRFHSWAKPSPAGVFSTWTKPALEEPWPPVQIGLANTEKLEIQASVDLQFGNVDPLYLFACHVEWERHSETSSAWELIAAAQTGDTDARGQARALLSSSHKVPSAAPCNAVTSKRLMAEANMKVPYGLEIIESCADCTRCKPGFFCAFSKEVAKAVDLSSHRSTLPAGAILFVEGQMPRGLFVLCSGKVKLSTTSREGKVLILKTAEAGEALGLSAAISGQSYEVTAQTATPCHVNFVDRRSLLALLHSHSEVGMHAAQSLSFEFQSAYRDMHDLVLARSSSGKLARLLLSFSKAQLSNADEARLRSIMTHEEMAQRIGSSRETVTRLLSDLKRKQLIRLDGATLVIQNRTALEALAV
jgi:CRP/FNR family transcriptional regulator, cyclic AMP receptor protein